MDRTDIQITTALSSLRAHTGPHGGSAVERETVDLKPTNTSIQATPRSNTIYSHPVANAVLAATIRAGIRRLDHRPYLGESLGWWGSRGLRATVAAAETHT